MRTTLMVLLLLVPGLASEAEDVHEVTDCEICGGSVYQTPKSYVSGNTKYVYIDQPPHKRYCTRCQRDINNGTIDPDNPPALAPRDDEETESDNPWAVKELDTGRPKVEKDAHAKEAETGFGALKWVVGIVIAFVLLFKFLLKN